MLKWLAEIKKYVDDVIEGKREPDANVGRQLMKLVSNTSQIPSKQFEQLVNNGMRVSSFTIAHSTISYHSTSNLKKTILSCTQSSMLISFRIT